MSEQPWTEADNERLRDNMWYEVQSSHGRQTELLAFFKRAAAEIERLTAELYLWRPLTTEEAEKELSEAEAVPFSEERIQEILRRATDPAERIPNSEQAQLVARLAAVTAERDRLQDKVKQLENRPEWMDDSRNYD